MKTPKNIIPFVGSKTDCEKEVELLKKQGITATIRKLTPKEHSFVKKLELDGKGKSTEYIRYAVLERNKRR
jgi:hypothetical protein